MKERKIIFIVFADYYSRPGSEDLDQNAYAVEPYLGRFLPVTGVSLRQRYSYIGPKIPVIFCRDEGMAWGWKFAAILENVPYSFPAGCRDFWYLLYTYPY